MSVINLALAASEADALFNKFTVKADGQTEDTFVHTADLVFPIANSAEAEILGQLIPGAKEMYLRASQEDTNWKTSVTVTPEIQSAHFELADAKTGRVVFKGAGEIKTATLRASKRETKLTVRVAFGGQVADTSMVFTRLLRSNVHVCYSASQQTLFKKEAGPARPLPQMGDVVCAVEEGQTVFGRAVEINDEDDGEATIILNDFGTEHVVAASGVKSFWTPAEADLEANIRSFKGRCTRRKLTASWSALTVAVGEAFGDGAPGEGPHLVTAKIVERAIDVLAKGAGGEGAGPDGDGGGEGVKSSGGTPALASKEVGLA